MKIPELFYCAQSGIIYGYFRPEGSGGGTCMKFSGLAQIPRLIVPLVALFFLSACTVAVEEGRPHHRPPPRPDRPQMCTMEYMPVCGVRNGTSRSFGNSCQARAAGYRIISDGECRSSRPRPPQWQHRPGRPGDGWGQNRPQTACTREYAPVCATSRGRSQTFPNACVARNAGYSNMRNGACR